MRWLITDPSNWAAWPFKKLYRNTDSSFNKAMKTLTAQLTAIALFTGAMAALAQTPPPYVIEFTSATYEGTEADGYMDLVLTSTPPFRAGDTNNIQVRIKTTDITTQRGNDYEYPVEGQALVLGNFNKWSDGRWRVGIPPINDGVHEPDETFEVTLGDLSPNAVLGARSTATVTIHNSAPTFLVQLSPTLFPDGQALVSEDFGSRPLLEVIRRGDRDVPVSVDLSFVGTDDPDGAGESLGLKAVPGVDFQAVNQRIEFASGETKRSIVVPILDDAEVEQVRETRYFEAILSRPSAGAVIWAYGCCATVGIVNNELPATLDVTHDRISGSPLVLFGREDVRIENGRTNTSTQPMSSDKVNFLPLPGGKKLAVGGFEWVNGVRRPGLARMDANDELYEGFRPPEGLIPWSDNFFILIPRLLVLQSGALLVPDSDRLFVRLKDDGSRDTSFPSGLSQVAEASDGSLWGVRSNEVVHLALDGSVLSSRAIPARTGNQALFAIQADGRLLIHDQTIDANSGEERIGLIRWLPDGSTDPSFTAIRPFWGAAVLPDGRLVRFIRQSLQVFGTDGQPDPSFPSVPFGKYGDGRSIFSVTLRGDHLRVFSPNMESVNGIAVQSGAYEFFLRHAPKTALQLSAQGSYDPESGSYEAPFYRSEPAAGQTSAFNVIFRRLGQSAGAASVTYATRDVTATAGKDYLPQSGTLTFAPLEVEKIVSIPILTDGDAEFDETLEVVITSAEGFEALPVPMRLTIVGDLPSISQPRLDRIKRLSDGRVLVDGSVSNSDATLESSVDLKTWRPIPGLQGGWSGGSGPAMWLDPSATNSGPRFYRAVLP